MIVKKVQTQVMDYTNRQAVTGNRWIPLTKGQ